MVEKHFPRGSQYHKYFNRNTVKVSYCTIPNMAGIIATHNNKVTSPPPTVDPKRCNCRTPHNCALNGQCLTENVIYECNVKSAEYKVICWINCYRFQDQVHCSQSILHAPEQGAQHSTLRLHMGVKTQKHTIHTQLVHIKSGSLL